VLIVIGLKDMRIGRLYMSKDDWYYSLKDKTYIKRDKKEEIEDDGDGEIVEV